MSWYKTGSVSVVSGQTSVTGINTKFVSNTRVGDGFRGPDGEWYEIVNMASETALGIYPAYKGTSVTDNADYMIAPLQGYNKESADRLRAITDSMSPDTEKFTDGGTVDLSSGQYPPKPPRAMMWKVGVGGIVDLLDYAVNDLLVYSFVLKDFYKINNADSAVPVTSVNGMVGEVVITKSTLDIAQVDNTSDINKPISIAQQAALDLKVDKVPGKGLSEEDFTAADKVKLAGLEVSHFRGSFLSLSALISGVSSPNVGDYADVDAGAGEAAVRYIWDASDSEWVASGSATPITAAQVKTLYESNPDTNAFTDSEKTKLSGIEAGATANATNAQLRDRATHTGTQLASTISDLSAAVRLVSLVGFSLANTAISESDSILTALGKTQGQINNRLGITSTAADSSKLNGKSASSYEKTLLAGNGIEIDRSNPDTPVIKSNIDVTALTNTVAAQQTRIQTLETKVAGYKTPEQVMTLGGKLTLTHPLGVEPFSVSAYIVCKETDADYPVGAVVPVPTFAVDYAYRYGVSIICSTTSIYCNFGSQGPFFVFRNDTSATSTQMAITPTKWRLVIKVRA